MLSNEQNPEDNSNSSPTAVVVEWENTKKLRKALFAYYVMRLPYTSSELKKYSFDALLYKLVDNDVRDVSTLFNLL